jgi:hypothetical protein
VARPTFTIDVDLSGFGQDPSLSIDAVATDGRRAAVAVPVGAREVNLDFPLRPLPQARPAGPHRAPPASPTAPLAPSPYN